MEKATAATINSQGSRTRYWTLNHNRTYTIVMLHGFSGNHMGFKELTKGLHDFRIIMPDLPGFGTSTPMTKQPHTVAGYAEFITDFLNKLDLPEPPVLLGHSFGSVIGARVAAKQPQLIAQKLVLISPTSSPPINTLSTRHLGARLGEAHYWMGVHLPGTLGEAWVKSAWISRTTSAMLTKTTDKKVKQAIVEHHLQDLEFLQHKNVFYQAYRSLNRDGIINYAKQIEKQVLLVAGAKDEMWPVHTQKQLAKKFSDATLEVLPGVGHLTHFEAPEKIAKRISSFLRS